MPDFQLHLGDCLEVMKTFPDNHFSSIVTDPPYGLSFMGKGWDHGVPGMPFWEAALRVAKPGAHLLAFGGTRTHHRLMVAIEDAGWEIRDVCMWLFGSGFPKSLDQSKAIQGVFLREFLAGVRHLRNTDGDSQDCCCGHCRQCGEPLHSATMDVASVEQLLGAAPLRSRPCEPSNGTHQGIEHRDTASYVGLSDHLSTLDSLGQSTADAWQLIQAVSSYLCPACFVRLIDGGSGHAAHSSGIQWSNIDALSVAIAWGKSEMFFRSMHMSSEPYNHYITTMERFKGYGSALKPAYEPIILARKPLSEPTIAANVLKHGTGGINVDACRIGTEAGLQRPQRNGKGVTGGWANYVQEPGMYGSPDGQGRWPANLALSDDAAAMLDEMSGERKSGGVRPVGVAMGKHPGERTGYYPPSRGGASRFFLRVAPDDDEPLRFLYEPKASKRDRDEGLEGMPERPSYMVENGSKTNGLNGERYERKTMGRNHHITVKPTALMRWFVRLVTPPGGIVLDPFVGSGSTLKAAILEGFDCAGIDLDSDYLAIAGARAEDAKQKVHP